MQVTSLQGEMLVIKGQATANSPLCTMLLQQSAFGVIGNSVFSLSRNKGKIIIWGRVYLESASSPVITDK